MLIGGPDDMGDARREAWAGGARGSGVGEEGRGGGKEGPGEWQSTHTEAHTQRRPDTSLTAAATAPGTASSSASSFGAVAWVEVEERLAARERELMGAHAAHVDIRASSAVSDGTEARGRGTVVGHCGGRSRVSQVESMESRAQQGPAWGGRDSSWAGGLKSEDAHVRGDGGEEEEGGMERGDMSPGAEETRVAVALLLHLREVHVLVYIYMCIHV